MKPLACGILAALLLAAPASGAWAQTISAEPPRPILPPLEVAKDPPPNRADRVELLATWLSAVVEHQPGAFDPAVQRVLAWPADDLEQLREHYPSVVGLIRQPDLSLFFRRFSTSIQERQIRYSTNELNLLRELARAHGAVEPADLCPVDDPLRRPSLNSANHLLKRIAVFHLDVSVAETRMASPDRPSNRSAIIFRFDDGRPKSVGVGAGHWELGREALDQVSQPCSLRPEPAKDPWLRDWYAASLLHQIARSRFDVTHLQRALELFRDDPEILFLGGVVHEALASPRIQVPLTSGNAPRERLRVASGSAELDDAENLLRRALRRGFEGAEIHLRLGNVLGLRGKHRDALPELKRAVDLSGELRLLAYYARMLYGRELEANGDSRAARVEYEQAARLFGRAQAPRLALAQLLRAMGDGVTATTTLASLLLETEGSEADDPWWTYHPSGGRSADRRFRELWDSTPSVVRR
jgi:tetratricopeptide (TPR) repeat protein